MQDVSHESSGSSREGLGLRAEDKLRRSHPTEIRASGPGNDGRDRSQLALEHNHSVRGRLEQVEDLTECATRCMGSSCR
jgi:hypothetical protein